MVTGSLACPYLNQPAGRHEALQETPDRAPVESSHLPHDLVRQRGYLGSLEYQLVDLGGRHPEGRRRRDGLGKRVTRAPSFALLLKQSGISKSLQRLPGRNPVDVQGFSGAGVGQPLTASGMDQQQPVRDVKLATTFQVGYPSSLSGSYRAAKRQFDPEGVALFAKPRWIEQLLLHRVLHDVDTTSRVLSQTEATEDIDDRRITGRLSLTQGGVKRS